MSWSDKVTLILAVTSRELTSIFRGKAERLLFVWTSLLFVPLITLGALVSFLLMRTPDVLHPVRTAMSTADAKQLSSLAASMRTFPEVALIMVDDPQAAFASQKCDAVITKSSESQLNITARTYAMRKQLYRVIDAARMRTIKNLVHNESVLHMVPYVVVDLSMEQYNLDSTIFKQAIIAVYAITFVYALLWLIPGIDIIRFDYMSNNLYANLCLPVSGTVLAAGKLLCGIVMTLLPTLLSAVAFMVSLIVALFAALDYFASGVGMDVVSFLPSLDFPFEQIILLPTIIIAAIAFLYATLMVIIFGFRGQRLGFFLSTNSLLLFGPLEIAYGIVTPSGQLWPAMIPFFGLANIVRQIAEDKLTLVSCTVALCSTFIATVLLLMIAGKLYSAEPSWRAWFGRKQQRASI